MAKAPPQQKPLDQFLDDLPVDTANEIRDTAALMMRNEQTALRLRGVELELRPFFIAATISFVIGMTILVFYSQPGEFLDSVAGAWPLLTAALGFLPGLLAYYAFRIRKRSQADIHNFDLNKEFFLPHGAIYFPSDSASAKQMVTLVEVQEAPIGRRSRWDKVKPGAIW
ncbi:MAG: hypothetical protein ACI89J_003323 [Hyphomicrobiaceae bacterium]|jgi:hypothetical protein